MLLDKKTLSRALLVSLFLISGIQSTYAFGIDGFAKQISSKGIPFAMILAILSITLKVLGSVLIIYNKYTELISYGLIVFTLIATYLFHDPMKNQREFDTFWRNISIVGGLFVLITYK
ncbi:MAG: hypothetical protein CMF62_04010 [Magnetococcales bacterium]|nr:hypothetical protein [Magnetococcales bacterium]|tara:strand:- start:883 stop:1236 length:354 start_codon:yes stop_codon:yes gene_type:complete